MDGILQSLLLFLFATKASRSFSGSPLTTVHVLLLNTTIKDCRTDVVNTAVGEAVEVLNSNANILSEITINLTVIFCQNTCTFTEAQDAFFSAIFAKPNELAVIGPACPTMSDPIAQLAHLYRIPMVSLAPFPSVSDYLFTIVPSAIQLMDSIVKFIEAFSEWQRLSIISQDQEGFRKVAVYLEQAFELKENVSISSSRVVSDRDINVNKLLDNSTRIIILNMESKMTRALLCKASSIQFPYVWIIPTSLHETWWLDSNNKSCPDADLHRFLINQGALLVRGVFSNSTAPSYQNLLPSLNVTDEANILTSLAYDSILSIAMGLNATNLTQLDDDISKSPGNKRTTGPSLRQHMNQACFDGYSGRVCFNDDGYRLVDKVQVLKFRKGKHNVTTQIELVGTVHEGESVQFTGEGKESVWVNGTPSDGTPIIHINYPIFALTLITYIFTGCNILLAIAGMVFMIIFRKKRVIRISSPYLNVLVGIGVILLSSATFLFVYPPLPKPTINVFCAIRPWLISLGYSVCLGTINTKMWRVYYICQNAKATAKKTSIKDWHLFLFVALFVAVDMIILTFATSFESSRQEATEEPDAQNSCSGLNENGIEILYQVITCRSTYRLHWLGPLLGYKIVYHIVAVFLAFKIRKVKVKVLNDSKEVVLVLYLTGVVLLSVIIITFAFGQYMNVYTGAYSVGICLTGAVVLAVVFGSKAAYLWKDPTGKEIFPTTIQNAHTAVSVAHPQTEINEILELQKKVKTLEAQLTLSTTLTVEEQANCLKNDYAHDNSEFRAEDN